MSTALIITGIVFFIGMAILLIRLLAGVETHSEKGDIVSDRTFIDGILSVFFYGTAFFATTICFTMLVPLFAIIPVKRILPMVRFTGRTILFGSGVWLTIKGKENTKYPKPFLLMFNHESLFDAFILASVTYRYIIGVGAAYQFKLPLWGWLLRRWGMVPIPRHNLKEAIKSIEIVKQKFREGVSVLIAPEGTRTLSGELQNFKKGPFHLALGAQADVLPMAIKGAYRIKRKTDWRLKPGKVEVEFGKIIPYESFKNMSVDELRDHVQGIFRELMSE